jgi:dUTP pyrophosphatase
VVVRFKRLRPSAVLPRYMTAGAAGMDLSSAADGPVTLEANGGRAGVPTGWAIELPAGSEGQVRPRSGLAAKHGVTIVNAPGTIDSDYRGELQVILANSGRDPVTIRRGDRIAQLVVAPVAAVEWIETDELSSSAREGGGFGSTGRE